MTAALRRLPNSAFRTREHLIETEVGKLIEAAKDNRYGQKHPNRCYRCLDVCACNCSGYKSDASARLAIAVLESVGRILPKLLLSLARPWIENRPNDREYQREIVSVADARRMVAHARAQGWLTPESKTADNRDLAHE